MTDVYFVYRLDADSWIGGQTFESVHATLEGARKAIPDDILNMKYDGSSSYLEDYRYYAIQKVPLKE